METQRNCSTEVDSNAVGWLVRAYREERKWSQEELARRWGDTRECVSQIENSRRQLTRVE